VNSDRTIQLWNLVHGRRVGRAISVPRSATTVALGQGGSLVLTVSQDGYARLWRGAWAAGVRPDGDAFASPSSTGDRITRLRSTVVTMAFSPDARILITGDDLGEARLWNAALAQVIGKPMIHAGPVRLAVFSPDARSVLTVSENLGQLWDTSEGGPLGQPLFHDRPITTAAFSPDGKTILTGSSDRTTRSWNATDGRPTGLTMTHPEAVTSVAYSPDGRTILTSSGAKAWLWDKAARPIGAALEHQTRISTCAFSPDARIVLTASDDGAVRLWNATDGRPIGNALNHRGPVTAYAFAPDGRTVAIAGTDGTAQVWNTRDATPAGPPMVHQGAITSLAFSPDGRTLVTASDDRTARLWEAHGRRPIGQPMSHPGRVTGAAFCPDGRTVLTANSAGGSLGQFSFWNAADGTRIGRAEEGIGNSASWSQILFGKVDREVIICNQTRFRHLRIPHPVPGDPERLRLWIEVMTGMELGNDQIVRPLDARTWRERFRRLEARGGPPNG
jgi:WD40 repeat protein